MSYYQTDGRIERDTRRDAAKEIDGSDDNACDTRVVMFNFWREHSKRASVHEMMLDEGAELLTQVEAPEILSLLPDLTNKNVLELGAGIGRFTGHIAEKANSVTAVDFIKSFVEKNEEINGNHHNITFVQADVRKLDIPENSVDVIFSNWLLMYLTDDEMSQFFSNCLRWLKEDGHLFFRESCFHQSGNAARTVNPTKYRDPMTYTGCLHMASLSCDNGNKGRYGFGILHSQCVETYVKLKANYDQICWLVQKVHFDDSSQDSHKTFQEFLDQQQYSKNGILRYEKIFGKHFVNTGGLETTIDFVNKLDLDPEQHVLDVGCGIGGGAFYMAETFNVDVTGIDLSFNMVSIAWERAKKIHDNRVKFLVADATKIEIPDESFDVVYSRDTILHIPDKAALFERFLGWLKPGGKLLISDYCCGEGDHSQQFTEYVKQRGYILYSPRQYGKILEETGFVNVIAEDETDLFVEVLGRELKRLESEKDAFLQEVSQSDYDAIIDGWKDKQVRCGQGDQRWGLFYAEKLK